MSTRDRLFAAGAVAVAASCCNAQTEYHLNSASQLTDGCHDPCLCPIIWIEDARGRFTLTYTHSDVLFDHYAITGFELNAGTVPSWHYVGTGRYQIGGDPGYTHRMQLDLERSGIGPAHFDSGFMPVESWLPNIVIALNDQVGDECVYVDLFLSMSPHCPADFDGDGDSGTDADIEAFFACIGGRCCRSCGSADFNNDGDTGTDADIEAFFRVLGGGSC